VALASQKAEPGDLILTLGAGNVSQLAPPLLAAIEAASARTVSAV
jgi:UDP-N-acetylmuramate-alanine ligase